MTRARCIGWVVAAVAASGIGLRAETGGEPGPIGPRIKGKKVAVAVFAQNEAMKPYEKTVQARLESILNDNAATILDEKKAAELKNVWGRLNDPGYMVTAEDFVQNGEKYEIEFLIRAFLNGSVVRGLGDYYTATAHVDLQVVDQGAKRGSETSSPMGVPGSPASDGLTDSSAMVNAVQRAVDDVSMRFKLAVLAPVSANGVDLRLSGPLDPVDGLSLPPSVSAGSAAEGLAKLTKEKWSGEKVSCSATAPGGSLAAVAGYTWETYAGAGQVPSAGGNSSGMDRIRSSTGGGASVGGGVRTYGSRIHLVDTERKEEVNVFPCEEMGRGGADTRKVRACAFASNWRYLAAVTGGKLLMWDTQRGKVVDSVEIPEGVDPSAVGFVSRDDKYYLVTGTKKRLLVYSIEKK